MATTHEARHVKAALIAASQDEDRPSICQVHVTEQVVEAADGHWLFRVHRDTLDGSSNIGEYDASAPRAVVQNVLAARKVKRIEFNSCVTARDEDGGELVAAELAIGEKFPSLDAAVPKITASHRAIKMSPELLIRAMRAMKIGGSPIIVTMFVPEKPFEPVLIRGEDRHTGAEFTAVIMPMSVAAAAVEEK